jgi:hypothetical protein
VCLLRRFRFVGKLQHHNWILVDDEFNYQRVCLLRRFRFVSKLKHRRQLVSICYGRSRERVVTRNERNSGAAALERFRRCRLLGRRRWVLSKARYLP